MLRVMIQRVNFLSELINIKICSGIKTLNDGNDGD